MADHTPQRRVCLHQRRGQGLLKGCGRGDGGRGRRRDSDNRRSGAGSEKRGDQQETIQGKRDAAFRHVSSRKRREQLNIPEGASRCRQMVDFANSLYTRENQKGHGLAVSLLLCDGYCGGTIAFTASAIS